MVTEHSAA